MKTFTHGNKINSKISWPISFWTSRCIRWNIWALTRQNLSLGFPTKWDSNQPAQLQRLARKLKFCPLASPDMILSNKQKTKTLIGLRYTQAGLHLCCSQPPPPPPPPPEGRFSRTEAHSMCRWVWCIEYFFWYYIMSTTLTCVNFYVSYYCY